MTTPQTLPIPRITQQHHLSTAVHEHAWTVESRHRTSEGTLVYVRCLECGVRRVDHAPHPEHPPIALSREIREG